MDSGRFFRNRLGQLIPVLVGISVIAFLMLRLIPGDPAVIMLGTHATPKQVTELRAELGLDRPVWEQYWVFVRGALHGDLGMSVFARRPVASVILERVPTTLGLVVYAVVIAVVLSLPAAIASGLNEDRLVDQAVRGLFTVALAMPGFWLGLILLLLLAVHVHWFPISGVGDNILGWLWHLFLPAFTLALPVAAMLVRSLRNSIIEVLRSPFVAFARAKGVRRAGVLTRHVLRNGLVSSVTILGLNIGWLVGGSVVIETVFSIPGLGSLAVTSVYARDYPVVQGLTLTFGFMVIIVNLLTDYVYSLLDPRVDYA